MSVALFTAAALPIAGRLGVLAHLEAGRTRHPVREAVSDYGLGPTRSEFTVMGMLAALGWALLAVATWVGHPSWADRTFATATLVGLAAITALIPLVPTDLEGERLTARGAVHYALAILQFGLAYNLSGNIARHFGSWFFQGLHTVVLVALIGLCACLLPSLRRWFGLFERVFIVGMSVFYLAYAVASVLGA